MNIDSNFDLRKFRDLLLKETYEPALDENDSFEEASLKEMAKITSQEGEPTTFGQNTLKLTPLGKRMADIIQSNPELEKSALLKALNSDPEIAKILAASEEELHQNQTNKFASVIRGKRELGQRGAPKKSETGPAAEPKTKAEKSPKLKITNPTADEKPVSSTFIDGEDEEEIAAEKQAIAAAKGGKRLGSAAEKLAQVTKEMKALIPAYQAAKGTPEEAAIVDQLKALTAEKKSLEAKVNKMFGGSKSQEEL